MNPLEEIIDASKKGYLKKKSVIFWTKRYVILHRNKPLITYLDSQNSTTARGTIGIENCSVLACDKELNMSYTFKVSNGPNKPLYFQAINEEERKEWMSAMIQEIQGRENTEPIIISNNNNNLSQTDSQRSNIEDESEWVIPLKNPEIYNQKSININDISIEKINKLFLAYADLDQDIITSNGIIKLCNDINMKDEEIIMLILSFHLNSTKFGKYTRIDFINGLESLRIDNLISLKEAIIKMKSDYDNNIDTLRKVYLFSFQLAAQHSKTLNTDVAVALIKVLLLNRYFFITYYCEFMKIQQHKLSYITKDQWTCFLEFCINIKEDLSNYQSSDGWPTLLDEFVEWMKTKRINMLNINL